VSAPNPQLFGPRSDGLQSEITLRDLFAMAALPALISVANSDMRARALKSLAGVDFGRMAYGFADLMLEERAKS
jgi:hypothetical protein